MTNAFLEPNERLRQNTLHILETMSEKIQEFSLPQPPETFPRLLAELKDNTYSILVVGEAKRGKSTFVNALIGKELLPTDADVATCQVFRISPSETESYRLRFEDDSCQDISRDGLAQFGSQVLADAGETPRLDQIIRWIEVECPTLFLPPGVFILDTPGLGALYAAHAQITYRFVPMADAVVFVLDSEAPIQHRELECIESILTVTSNIFFIQTKIDAVEEAAWETIRERNETILKEHLGDRLASPQVWPISSLNLLQGADNGPDAEAYVYISRHQALSDALQAFLNRVVGWYRATHGALIAEKYHSLAFQTLQNRLNAVNEESKAKQGEIQKRIVIRKQQFEAEWGESGAKRKAVMERLKKVMAVGKQGMVQCLSPTGDIAARMEVQIEGIESVSQANAIGKTIVEEVIGTALNRWHGVCCQTGQVADELMAQFHQDIEKTCFPDAPDLHRLVSLKFNKEFTEDLWPKVRQAKFDSMIATAITMTGMQIAYGVGLVNPLAGLAVVAAAALWAGLTGWKSAKANEVKKAQAGLRKLLSDVLGHLRRQLMEVDITTGQLGRVDEYFISFERAVGDYLTVVRKQKAGELEAERKRMEESFTLNESQRREAAAQIQNQLTQWEECGQAIRRLLAELRVVDQSQSKAVGN